VRGATTNIVQPNPFFFQESAWAFAASIVAKDWGERRLGSKKRMEKFIGRLYQVLVSTVKGAP